MNMGNKRTRSPTLSSVRQRLPLITLNKTFLLTKINFNKKTFDSKVVFEDYSHKITCFEVITTLNLVIISTVDNLLMKFKILEVNGKLYDKVVRQLDGRVEKIYQIGTKKIIVPVFKGEHTMMEIINPKTLEKLSELKLKESVMINKLAYFDDSFLFALVPAKTKKSLRAEKVYLYDTNITLPRKCFMLSASQIIDCCMPTTKNLFVGSIPNELKFFQVNFGSPKPFVFDFSMKLKANVRRNKQKKRLQLMRTQLYKLASFI